MTTPDDEESPRPQKLRMTKKGRKAARSRLRNDGEKIASGKPKTMPSSRQRMHPGMNPTINNPNNSNVIVPQGQPLTLRER